MRFSQMPFVLTSLAVALISTTAFAQDKPSLTEQIDQLVNLPLQTKQNALVYDTRAGEIFFRRPIGPEVISTIQRLTKSADSRQIYKAAAILNDLFLGYQGIYSILNTGAEAEQWDQLYLTLDKNDPIHDLVPFKRFVLYQEMFSCNARVAMDGIVIDVAKRAVRVAPTNFCQRVVVPRWQKLAQSSPKNNNESVLIHDANLGLTGLLKMGVIHYEAPDFSPSPDILEDSLDPRLEGAIQNNNSVQYGVLMTKTYRDSFKKTVELLIRALSNDGI